ncbi:hypothetical protein D9758_002542 [Tetrapyrgos nigripes]|uniref:Endonuclease/exonuclease/phosphatase domain-containing protein n=1 Tax=Tetrapyrgos nigripes TaxID=182062 RepID=A0A8H5LU24_9AGAR|nr:hypothetical protein D9758_002542 [Tetrapyrgos nigripes]
MWVLNDTGNATRGNGNWREEVRTQAEASGWKHLTAGGGQGRLAGGAFGAGARTNLGSMGIRTTYTSQKARKNNTHGSNTQQTMNQYLNQNQTNPATGTNCIQITNQHAPSRPQSAPPNETHNQRSQLQGPNKSEHEEHSTPRTANRNNNDTLRILQLNVNNSATGQLALVNGHAKDYHLIALQEPAIDFLGNTKSAYGLRLIYPPKHRDDPKRTRSVILVNRNILTGVWTTLPINNPDVTAIQITGSFGTLCIYNLYIAGGHSQHDEALIVVHTYMNTVHANQVPKHPLYNIWLGDFNQHHPSWDEERNSHLFTSANLRAADTLIEFVGQHNMMMGTFTNTRRILHRPPNADHIPIITELNLRPPIIDETPRYNWKAANWEDIREQLKQELPALGPPKEIETIPEFWMAYEGFRKVINNIIEDEQLVLKTKLLPYERRWWNEELAGMQRDTRRLGRKSYAKRANQDHPVHEEYRRLRNALSGEIKRAKAEHWMDWIENAEGNMVWTIGSLVEAVATDGGRTRMPGLVTGGRNQDGEEVVEEDNEGKANLFKTAFYPPLLGQTQVPRNARYPAPAWQFQLPTGQQTSNTIHKFKNGKAT